MNLCTFGLHRWEKWELMRKGDIIDKAGRVKGNFIDQEKHCKVCNYIVIREIRT